MINERCGKTGTTDIFVEYFVDLIIVASYGMNVLF